MPRVPGAINTIGDNMSAPQQPGYNAPVQGKSRTVAGLLNLLLGGIAAGTSTSAT